MNWKITCYNGEVWMAPHQMTLTDAIKMFCGKTSYSEVDIKLVENLS